MGKSFWGFSDDRRRCFFHVRVEAIVCVDTALRCTVLRREQMYRLLWRVAERARRILKVDEIVETGFPLIAVLPELDIELMRFK